MLTPFYEARAWRIATQIVRRAPMMLTLLESEFADGFYILHSIVPRDAPSPWEAHRRRVVDVNRHGTIVSPADRQLPSDLEKAAREPTLLFDRAPGLYRNLTAQLGLPDPRPLPRSTPEVLSFRFVVAWLQLHAALGRSYASWQGVDSYGKVRGQYFAAFQQPELAELAMADSADPKRWHPAHRFWFIAERDDPPVACVGSDGMLRTPDGAVFDLGRNYRKSGRNMWAVVATTRAHLEGIGLVQPP